MDKEDGYEDGGNKENGKVGEIWEEGDFDFEVLWILFLDFRRDC
nr:hypothetical protein [Bacillus pumilus]